ncbi:MAG: hypothetical protein C0502_05925 [Opitutus sp.]|nr:hypothetical protein [Opitutus sp.]
MPGPTRTTAILVLYGHGALSDATFDFKRDAGARLNLYSWTREGIPVWDTQIELAANSALQDGEIRDSYATVNSSRIGGTRLKNYVLAAPTGLRPATVPAGFQETQFEIEGVAVTVQHNAATIAASTRMLLTIDENENDDILFLTDFFNDANFADRQLDVLWCACKS